jgi:hypothetical protein
MDAYVGKKYVIPSLHRKSKITCGTVPTGTVRGTPNLLAVDIPLTKCKHNVNATMIRKKLFEACMNASVFSLARLLVCGKGTKSGMAVSGVLGRKSLFENSSRSIPLFPPGIV